MNNTGVTEQSKVHVNAAQQSHDGQACMLSTYDAVDRPQQIPAMTSQAGYCTSCRMLTTVVTVALVAPQAGVTAIAGVSASVTALLTARLPVGISSGNVALGILSC